MKYFKTEVRNLTVHGQEFDSISDLTSYLKSQPISTLWKNSGRELGSKNNRSWSGTNTFEEAERLLNQGWQVKAEALAKKVPVKVTGAQTVKTKPSYGVVGHQASVPRYVMGVPQNMINNKPVTVNQKIITINKSVCFPGSVTPEQIEEEGVKALQIIQALEGKGYRIKLNLIIVSEGGKQLAIGKVCVKKPEERLSLIKVAFPIAHTGMLRRIMFNWLEKFEALTANSFAYGYGTPREELYKGLLKKGEYLLPNFIPDIDEWIKEQGL